MNKEWRDVISQPEHSIQGERDVFVPLRDGTCLALNIYRPSSPGRYPALLAMGGYGKELQDLLIGPQPLSKSAVWDGCIEAGDTTEIVPRGYAHVIGDVRGTGNSEGEYSGMSSTQEGKDGYDVVEWIAQQPWCDGNVGMIGYSYYGQIQLKIAIEQPPHLKAIFVSHLFADFYRDAAYHGGVLSLFFYGLWDGRHGTSGFAPKNVSSRMKKSLTKEEFERRREELLNHPDVKHYPNLYHLLNYPYKNPWFFDMVMNPLDGPFWRDHSIYPFYDRIKVPTFVIGKVAHDSGCSWDVYNGIRAPKKLFVKPNEPEERPWREDLDLIIRWNDHWLKGKDTGIMNESPIRIFVQGINQYHSEEKWPVSGVEWINCYLRRWEWLSFAPELYQDEPDCFLQQPLHLSNKRDSLKYQSPPMPENLTVIGPAALNIFASIDQDDTNWFVKLYDVAPNGIQARVGKGYLKASHRELDTDLSKPYAPYHKHKKAEPVVPGEINEYDIALGNISTVFQVGHRIKLEIDSMESPRDLEMQIHYHPHLCSSKTTLHKIYRNKQHQSHLVLPLVSAKQPTKDMLSDDNFLE